MAAYIKGTVKQALPGADFLKWEKVKPWTGNEIKFSSLLAIDAPLDTSKFHISVPINGEEPYVVDGKNYSAREGDYFIFNPQQEARASGNFKEHVDGICIFIDEKTIQETAHVMFQPIQKIVDSPFDYSWQQQEFLVKNYRLSENSFGKYLSNLVEKLLTKPEGQLIDWDAFYYEIAAEFLKTHRQIGRQLEFIPSNKTNTKQEIYRRLSLAHVHILENYDSPFSLEELGKIAFFSKFYLVRLYRKVFGLTPYQHVLQLRIEKAKQMLLDNFSPTEIALQLSFSDRRAFAKVFKKMEGMAPSVFQQKAS